MEIGRKGRVTAIFYEKLIPGFFFCSNFLGGKQLIQFLRQFLTPEAVCSVFSHKLNFNCHCTGTKKAMVRTFHVLEL